MKYMIAIAAVSAAAMSASAGGLTIGQYLLGDHPGGGENPPPYGLRLDGIVGAGAATLSLGHHSDTILTVIDDGGTLSINISGTLYGGAVDGMGGYVSATSYAIDMDYVIGVSDEGNGWAVNGFTASNSGTLTNLDTMAVIDLYGKDNSAGLVFAFLADGHRLTGDDTSWVGRGWITDQSDGTDPHSGFRDWLFTATEVPAPGAFALVGLGGLCASRRRR
jgi:MYXO-CTERM domain-containing protein